jgi:L-alanine-DL-glutamate epimerase-like enolase superfamily enzyme
MKITDIEVINYTQPKPPILKKRVKGAQEMSLVRIVTDEGVEGYAMGRANGGTSGQVLGESIVKTLKPYVVDQDPLNRENIWQAMWHQERIGYAPIFSISMVDVALWDLAGKILNVPVYQLAGGFRDRIRSYASSAFLNSTEEYIEDARLAVERGIQAYKIHPFLDPNKDIELCRVLREAVGSDVDLMLDVVNRYDRTSAMRVGRILEELDFLWYEEPLSHYDIEGYVNLSRDLDIPIAGAEAVAGGVYSTAIYVRANALDLIMCDTYWRGGITGMLKTAHLCEAMGLKLISHHGASPIMNLANLHCLCSISNADFIEVLVPEKEYEYGLKTHLRVDVDGYLSVPQKPGLGAEIDWDYIHAHTTGKM